LILIWLKQFMNRLQTFSKKFAEAFELEYVSGNEPGIVRVKRGKGFSYLFNGKPVDGVTLDRIKKLVLPPAWRNVWISTLENAHLQATGYDIANRKQYKYHALWTKLRNESKFGRLREFGKCLPALRGELAKDIRRKKLSCEKVISTVITLMEKTCIRIGNAGYEKAYGSHGLTTLKDKHVTIHGQEIHFTFKGKKGVYHDIILKNRKLARIVKQFRDLPGKDLFQFEDSNGRLHVLDSEKVNEYIRMKTGKDFSSKDFRTWAGTMNALRAFKKLGVASSPNAAKKKIVEALDDVSKRLGNTRSVCKKYYVHPKILDLYMDNGLDSYLKKIDPQGEEISDTLTKDEEVLMKILEKSISHHKTKVKVK
jgi:DNA topoisomerase-1